MQRRKFGKLRHAWFIECQAQDAMALTLRWKVNSRIDGQRQSTNAMFNNRLPHGNDAHIDHVRRITNSVATSYIQSPIATYEP